MVLPGLRRMLVVAKLDRLARSTALIAALMESGVDFVTADVPMANRFTLHILAAVAEYEARLISERTKAAFAAAKARGTPLRSYPRGGPPVPEATLKAATRARHERSIARARQYAPLFCALRDRGETLAGIAAHLALMGIEPINHGRTWYPSVIKKIFESLENRRQNLAGVTAQINGACNPHRYCRTSQALLTNSELKGSSKFRRSGRLKA